MRKNKQYRTPVYFLAILLLLGSNSCNKLEEGYVVAKWYEPEQTYVSIMPMVLYNGKTTTTIFVPYVVTDNEDWCIKVKGKYKDEGKVETVYVSKKEYESLSIGSHWRKTDGSSMSDDNNHKERKE